MPDQVTELFVLDELPSITVTKVCLSIQKTREEQVLHYVRVLCVCALVSKTKTERLDERD